MKFNKIDIHYSFFPEWECAQGGEMREIHYIYIKYKKKKLIYSKNIQKFFLDTLYPINNIAGKKKQIKFK